MFLHYLGVALVPIFRLLICASSQPIILCSCNTSVSFRVKPTCFSGDPLKVLCLTCLKTVSAPVYTRQSSFQTEDSPLWYSSTIRSSTAFNNFCSTRIPLQVCLALLFRSPSSQESTVPSTVRNSFRSSSELGHMSYLILSVPSISSLSLSVPDSAVSITGGGAFLGLPGLQGGASLPASSPSSVRLRRELVGSPCLLGSVNSPGKRASGPPGQCGSLVSAGSLSAARGLVVGDSL